MRQSRFLPTAARVRPRASAAMRRRWWQEDAITGRSRAGVWCLAAWLLVCLAACGKSAAPDLHAEIQQMVDEIPSVVSDSVRAGKVRDAYRRIGDALTASVDERRRISARFRDLYRRYDTPRESLEVLIAAAQAESGHLRDEALGAREAIRTQTTEKEWKDLSSTRKRLAKLIVRSGP